MAPAAASVWRRPPSPAQPREARLISELPPVRSLNARHRPAPGMPERHDFNALRRRSVHAIVDVVPDSVQKDSPHTSQPRISRKRANEGICRDQIQSVVDVFRERERRLRSILIPPRNRVVDLLVSPASEKDKQPSQRYTLRSLRRTSSAGITSPRSASAIDSRSSASSSRSSSKVSSSSRARSVTTVPSGSGSPSTSTCPDTTRPDAMRIPTF